MYKRDTLFSRLTAKISAKIKKTNKLMIRIGIANNVLIKKAFLIIDFIFDF